MIRTHQRSLLLALGSALVLAISAASCFVSIDESKIQDGVPPAEDAGTDADASVQPDGDAAVDQLAEAKPDGDAAKDAISETPEGPETSWPEASSDADGGDFDAEAGDVPDANWIDAPLVECVDDFDCPPVGCTLRTCDNGACKAAGVLHEDVSTFELPAPLSCNQGYNRTCVVAARNYLIALTPAGFVAFNTRNPTAARQEAIPGSPVTGYSYLVRSGERIWAAQDSGGVTPVAWLDIPLDGSSPFSAPDRSNLILPPVSARFAAPNDALLLYFTDVTPTGFFARFSPGMPTALDAFPTNGANEFEVVGSSGSRALLHTRIDMGGSPSTFQHRFSLQTDVTSSSSLNGGPYDEATLNNFSGTYGYFAQSRKGAVAWVVARHDGNQWAEVRAYWLLSGSTLPIDSAYYSIETFTAPPATTPEGPLAFINDDTVAAAVLSASATPTLDIVQRASAAAPKLLKRIPISPLAPGALSVTGDGGYAYVVTGTTVRVFAPACSP